MTEKERGEGLADVEVVGLADGGVVDEEDNRNE